MGSRAATEGVVLMEKIDGLDEPRKAGSQDLDDDDSQELLHVLAVDDSLVDRKVIERLLKISSCKVTAVDSGTRALQYLGLDGEENSTVGFNDLKGSSAFREIPVVIMSSENVLPRINRCLEEGAEDFIVKPVKLSDVKRLKDYIMREELVTAEENRDVCSCWDKIGRHKGVMVVVVGV
ncbi:hypothetical protein Sjap_015957 [Stephania japonica]|uniref:Response regulatory domain-containing protein n=1 Tax=Stephania japonica TaxID=461633 RepID=A0AAP0NTB0_9MAGN